MPNNSFKPTPCRGIGHVLYATLAHVRRPDTGRLNSGVRLHTMPQRLLTIDSLSALLAACGQCGSNGDAIAFASGLSQQRLAQLFRDTQAIDLAGQLEIYIDTRSNVPDAFKDLKPLYIARDGRRARIHLSGCVDDKVFLFVDGIGNNGRKEITLQPGEAKDSIALWQSN